MDRPDVLVLDVNETLTDLEPMRARMAAVGLPEHTLDVWFAQILRDGFALTAAGAYAPFKDLAADALRVLCLKAGVGDPDAAIPQVLSGFAELSAHPDVAEGLRRIHEAGVRIIALTNGASAISDKMFTEEGLMDLLEHRLSVDTPQCWKPAPGSYRFAAETCGVAPEQMALAAVHPWDIDGAQRAGLTGYYIDRRGTPYPSSFRSPDVTVADFMELADRLTG